MGSGQNVMSKFFVPSPRGLSAAPSPPSAGYRSETDTQVPVGATADACGSGGQEGREAPGVGAGQLNPVAVIRRSCLPPPECGTAAPGPARPVDSTAVTGGGLSVPK